MRFLKYFIILFIFAFAVFMVMSRVIKSSTPPFLSDKLEELRDDKALMDSIGGFDKFEYSFNKEDFNHRDTIKYSILINGHEKKLIYRGIQSRVQGSDWKLVSEALHIE